MKPSTVHFLVACACTVIWTSGRATAQIMGPPFPRVPTKLQDALLETFKVTSKWTLELEGTFKLVHKVLVISKFYFFKISGRWEIATEFKCWRTILVRLIFLFHGIKVEQEKTFYSSTSYNYQPLNYPDLGKSVYIVHKEIPRQKDPEPAIPECFTKAVEKPTSIEAKQLHDTLEPLNSVHQTGHGKDQAEIALAKPVKVKSLFHTCYIDQYRSLFFRLRNLSYVRSLNKKGKETWIARKRDNFADFWNHQMMTKNRSPLQRKQ